MEKVDNELYHFLNRESNKGVINPAVDLSTFKGEMLLYDDCINEGDYSSPLEDFSKLIYRNNMGDPNGSVDPLIHKLKNY